jgi:hypothetical protein
MKYVYIPYLSNVESFRVDASHAGMLGVFTSKNTKDGLVVDGFPTMLISMLILTFTHTTDGYVPSHITLSIVSRIILFNCDYDNVYSSRDYVIRFILHQM